MQCGQVFAVLDSVLGALQNLFDGEVSQCLKPEFLDLVELLRVWVRRVILIVVIQPKQRENLVNGLGMGGSVRGGGVTWPRRCL